MPNKERLRLWVQALRDPNLVQGFGCLAQRQTEDEPWQQCCLDVACQVAIANGLRLIQKTSEVRTRGHMRTYTATNHPNDFSSVLLPFAVLEWYELSGETGVSLDGVTAAELNDERMMTFVQIADIIETHFKLDETGE